MTKTNIDGNKDLRYELDATIFKNWLTNLKLNGVHPYALYFEFKRKVNNEDVDLNHIEIVPVYTTATGNIRKESQALTIAISTPGVSLVSFPNGEVITSIPPADQPDYRALEHFVDRVGFVMFGFKALKYMVDHSTHVFVSSSLCDPRTFQFEGNPEDDANYPIYTLKVEIQPQAQPPTPGSNPMDNLYPPYLLGTPCSKKWYEVNTN